MIIWSGTRSRVWDGGILKLESLENDLSQAAKSPVRSHYRRGCYNQSKTRIVFHSGEGMDMDSGDLAGPVMLLGITGERDAAKESLKPGFKGIGFLYRFHPRENSGATLRFDPASK